MCEAIRERKLFSKPRGVRGVGTHTVSEAAVKTRGVMAWVAKTVSDAAAKRRSKWHEPYRVQMQPERIVKRSIRGSGVGAISNVAHSDPPEELEWVPYLM